MENIQLMNHLNEKVLTRLLLIWESAVTETHKFLSDEDINQIRPDVKMAIGAINYLYCYYENEQILGFVGVENEKIEMLFIDATARGKGIGKQLVTYATENLKARYVDVNEQNIQGVGFYRHMGFSQKSRSEQDGQGRPFPLLHMEKS